MLVAKDSLDRIQSYNLAKYGIFILGVSLWLWIARLALKLSFSNRHLAEEAKEKSVMINTYLALTKEGQMD